jgi:hypothetical protein
MSSRRPRRPELIDPFPDRPRGEVEAPVYDPAARYAIREGMELALVRAIQQLPGRQRPVLIFRDVLGWTAPSRMLLTPTPANGRPAVAAHRRNPDGGLAPHGVLVLEIARGAVTQINAFINPSLVPRFASPAGAD